MVSDSGVYLLAIYLSPSEKNGFISGLPNYQNTIIAERLHT